VVRKASAAPPIPSNPRSRSRESQPARKRKSCPRRGVPRVEKSGVATSFGALAADFAFGAGLVGLIAVIAVIGWGYFVRVWAKEEARAEAERCANKRVKELMDEWLAREAPQIVRRHIENLMNASLGEDDEEAAAEEMGKEAG
jgi:hypothetical protein